MAYTMKQLVECICQDVGLIEEIVSGLESDLEAEKEKSSSLEDRVDELIDELDEVHKELSEVRSDLVEANCAVERLTDEVADLRSRGG